MRMKIDYLATGSEVSLASPSSVAHFLAALSGTVEITKERYNHMIPKMYIMAS